MTTSLDVLAEPQAIVDLTDALGYQFADLSLLELALTHRSYCAENGNIESNERLEFLGDAILGAAVAERLFINNADQPEGFLAKARADVVSASSLARAATQLSVGEALRLGKGEEQSNGREKVSILADAMEAIIAAVYLDGGMDAAKDLIDRHIPDADSESGPGPGRSDYKSRLQEWAAEMSLDAPEYEMTSTGPDHNLVFVATVRVGTHSESGSGTSKKQAQQQAARAVLVEVDGQIEEKIDRTGPGSGQSEQQPATVPCGGTQ